jgi:hypothetical protein
VQRLSTLRRRRALIVSSAALSLASGPACTTLLGLDPPTLAPPCPDGCHDASGSGESTTPIMDATNVLSDGDSSSPNESGSKSAPSDGAPTEGATDLSIGPPSPGTRCGQSESSLYCASPQVCCVTVKNSLLTYSCEDAVGCSPPAYSIECALDEDCHDKQKTPVCCYFSSGIKCEADGTKGCEPACDSTDPHCSTSQSCLADTASNGYELPYYSCQ